MKKFLCLMFALIIGVLFVGCNFNPDSNKKLEEQEFDVELSDGTIQKISLSNSSEILEIKKTGQSSDGLKTDYTVYYKDGSEMSFSLTNGNGIESIKKENSDGLVDKYVINLTDGTSYNFTVTNGNGIANISKNSSDDLIDNYTIELTNGAKFVFSVKNGKDGVDGKPGIQGIPGKDGVDGKDGKSAYEIYLEHYPKYNKSEEEWLDDLINGRLGIKDVHTVSFNVDGVIESVKVDHSYKVTKPLDPEKEGYTFKGWFYKDYQWNFDLYPVLDDMMLTAKWEEVKIESISLIVPKDKLLCGETMKVEAVLYPINAKNDLVWTSSDSSIINIDAEGNVTAGKDGVALISVYSKNDTSISVSYELRVERDDVVNTPTSININGPETLTVGYKAKYNATVSPFNANSDVVWQSTDTSVVKIDENGIATAVNAGTARIRCVSAVDSSIKSNMIKVVVEEEIIYDPQDLKGYKIVIMNASSALADIDPFLEGYNKHDKLYKQVAWKNVEKKFNCKISVEPYPDSAPWGTARINYIIDNAANGTSTADLSVISSNWLYQLANDTTNAAADVTDYYNKYGKQQMAASLREAGSYKGKIYTASTGISKTATYVDLGLYYNMAWVEKLRVEDPAQMFVDGKWNYTGFRDWCQSVQALLYSNEHAIGGHAYYFWFGMTNAAGIKIADTSTVSVNIDSQRSKDAAQLIYQLVQADAVDTAATWAESDGGFIAGTTVMTTGNMWFLNNSSRWSENMFGEDTRYGYVPFPYPDDMAKEDTRISTSGLSILMYTAGRESGYPEGVTLDGVYQAVNAMYLDTIKHQESNPSFDADSIIYNSLSSRLDNDASIECVKWFTSERVFFDPAHGIYSSTAATPLKTPAINTMMKGKDYQQEFDAVKDTFETYFKKSYS